MTIKRFSKILHTRLHDEEEEENPIRKEAKGMRIARIREMSVLDIIEYVVKITEDQPLSETGPQVKFLKVLSERLGITPLQALLLAVFINLSDDQNITQRDLAGHFDGNNISVLKCTEDIESFVERGIIMRNGENRGRPSYCVPQTTLEALGKGELPAPVSPKKANVYEWFDAVEQLMQSLRFEHINNEEFELQMQALFDSNQELECVRQIRAHGLDVDDLKLFMIMSLCAINNHDDFIGSSDIDDYYKRAELHELVSNLEAGDHILFCENLIEHVCNHGMVDTSHWKLTDFCKKEVYSEFRFHKSSKGKSELIEAASIQEKPLFYDVETTKQVDELRNLLEPNRMNAILERLKATGQRCGFACLFYGTPGTGKTETVMQLARATGRDIMQVNISTIRDKYVGETEHNIQDCFDNYRKYAKGCENAPILLFNEADALFTTRNNEARYGVDKMENAMQNIILQEMESLEGILIATTNLEDSMDPAFERRFLYKLKFPRPTLEARCSIWQTKIPALSHGEATLLAERFDFSGGEIENIARKSEIERILADRDEIDKDALMEICKHETLDKKKSEKARVGFVP